MQLELYVQENFSDYSFDEGNTDEQITIEVWENWFQQWMEIMNSDIPPAPSYEVSLLLTNDNEIQLLNSEYRQQNKPTDVLAFAALEVDYPQPINFPEPLPLCLGDIVVSMETAFRQSIQQGHSLKTELAWLTAHGFLHLIGWDHPDETSLVRMLNQQVILLRSVDIAIQLE